jgi:hypothetical protein
MKNDIYQSSLVQPSEEYEQYEIEKDPSIPGCFFSKQQH